MINVYIGDIDPEYNDVKYLSRTCWFYKSSTFFNRIIMIYGSTKKIT